MTIFGFYHLKLSCPFILYSNRCKIELTSIRVNLCVVAYKSYSKIGEKTSVPFVDSSKIVIGDDKVPDS